MIGVLLLWAAAEVLPVPALVSAEVLEPSVRNEVEHALSRAPKDFPAALSAEVRAAYLASVTNGAATEVAIRLVSAQRADGRWLCGTNDVTAAALELLRGM